MIETPEVGAARIYCAQCGYVTPWSPMAAAEADVSSHYLETHGRRLDEPRGGRRDG